MVSYFDWWSSALFFVLVAGVVGSCGGVGVAASEREENEHIYIST